MPHHRGGRIDQARVHDGAFQQLVGRTHQAEGPRFHQGLVGRQRNEAAQGLDRPLDHDVGPVDGVVAHLAQKGWIAVETVIPEKVVREIIPALKALGAEGIIEYPLNKLVY